MSFCRQSCRPRYFEGNSYECVSCSSSESPYYTINEYASCLPNTCIGNKIIDQTYECTDRDLSLYKLGDFYYFNKPSNTDSCPNKICSCLSYYVIRKL